MKAISLNTIITITGLFLYGLLHSSNNDSVNHVTINRELSFKKQESAKYKLVNENLIFSFTTQNAKILSLCMDKNGQYLIYRFGTADKIELEFPKTKDRNSFSNFEYTGWERHGGVKNEGMNLNYIVFELKENKYIIYETYFAVGDVSKVGIKIINRKTNKEIDISGLNRSKKGTLSDFRTDNRIKKGNQLYD